MQTRDLTELTGIKANADRMTTIATFQFPVSWIKPGFIGLLVAIPFAAVASIIFGTPSLLLLTFIGPVLGIALMVSEGEAEAPWKRMRNRAMSLDGKFIASGQALEMYPTTFFRNVPGSTTVYHNTDKRSR